MKPTHISAKDFKLLKSEQRQCLYCKKGISKDPNYSWKAHFNRKYCNMRCKAKAMIGKKHTPEAIMKMRINSLGKPPGNKGWRGIFHHSPETIARMRQVKGSAKGNWKGDKVKLAGLHAWMRKQLIKPQNCQDCSKQTLDLDLANISQKYKREFSDWEWLCRRCHMVKDGRILKNLHRFQKGDIPWNKDYAKT